MQITDVMIRAGNGERYCSAQVAELVDALVSGISDRKIVEVRVFSWAPNSKNRANGSVFYCLQKSGRQQGLANAGPCRTLRP